MRLKFTDYLVYKLFNSLFLGISIGALFVVYSPIKPYVYSVGGLALGVGLLVVAFFYEKILHIKAYFWISLFVELVIFAGVVVILMGKFSLVNALFVYIGYQISFMFGSYLSRAETIVIQNHKKLSRIDIAKQVGYLLGMGISLIYYRIVESVYDITSSNEQVYNIHYILFAVEVMIIIFLLRSFDGKIKKTT